MASSAITIDNVSFHLVTPIQLRTTDIDMYMHVNNTRYLDYYDLGKAQYFRTATDNTWKLSEMLTVIVNVNCSYIKSVHYNNEVQVLTRCEKIGTKSFTIHQMLVDTKTTEVYSECRTVMVCVNPKTRQSVDVPQTWRESFSKFEGVELQGNSPS